LNELGIELDKARQMNIFALVMTCFSMSMDTALTIIGVKKWRKGTLGESKVYNDDDESSKQLQN
jgi:hypothetical protein